MWDANSVKGSGGHMLVTGLSDKSLGADVSASQRKPGQSRGNSRCIGPVVIESQSSGSAYQAHGHTWQTWLAASDLKCFLPSLLSSPTHPLAKSVVLNQAVLVPDIWQCLEALVVLVTWAWGAGEESYWCLMGKGQGCC